MTIREIMSMCIEPGLCNVEIYSSEEECIIWSGCADEIPVGHGDLEFDSFDVPTDGSMTFNVE